MFTVYTYNKLMVIREETANGPVVFQYEFLSMKEAVHMADYLRNDVARIKSWIGR